MVLLFLGPPGSGKDTQAELLAAKLGYKVVSTGQVMREEVEKGGELATEAEKFMRQGKWVPDEIVYKLLEQYLKTLETKNIIFTGAVRRASQIPLLDGALKSIDSSLDKVLYFDLPDSEVMNRIANRWFCEKDGTLYNVYYPSRSPKVAGVCDKCGGQLVQREDDKPEIVKTRLEEVRKYDQEILDDYERRGLLLRLDASPSVEEIASNVIQKLDL